MPVFTPPDTDTIVTPAWTPPADDTIVKPGKSAVNLAPININPLDNQGVFRESGISDGTWNGAPNPQGPDFALTRAIAQNPVGFVASLPGDVLSISGGLASLPYNVAVDTVSKIFDDKEYGGNIKAMMENPDAPAPVDKFLKDAAKTNPVATTLTKIAKGVAETAPFGVIGGLPAAAQKWVVRGFTADMLIHAPLTVRDLVKEYDKPKDQQDPDKLTSLWSDAAQQIGFGALGAAHEVGAFRKAMVDKYVPRGQGVGEPIQPKTAETTAPVVNADELKKAMTFDPAKAATPPVNEPAPVVPPVNEPETKPPVVEAKPTESTPATETKPVFNWDSSVQDAHDHWGKLTDEADKVESENTAKIAELSDQLKATKKRDEKKELQNQINVLQGKTDMARMAAEGQMIEAHEQFNPEIEAKATAAGVPAEKVNDFKQEFWDTVFERPGVEWSHDKNFQQVFDAVKEQGETVEAAKKTVEDEQGVKVDLPPPPAGITVSPEQWREMANFNDTEQQAKYGTTRAKLLQEAVMKPEGPATPEPENESAANLRKLMERLAFKQNSEAQGQNILDEAETSGRKVGDIINNFVDKGLPSLPAQAQTRVLKYVLRDIGLYNPENPSIDLLRDYYKPGTKLPNGDMVVSFNERPGSLWSVTVRDANGTRTHMTTPGIKDVQKVLGTDKVRQFQKDQFDRALLTSKEELRDWIHNAVEGDDIADLSGTARGLVSIMESANKFSNSSPAPEVKTLAKAVPAKPEAPAVEHIKEVASGEKPIPAEVDRLPGAAKASTARTAAAKEIKTELVQRIEDAIAKAPSESELNPRTESAEKKFGKVTIDIPGDGVFSVVNSKEALGQVLERAQKLSTASNTPAKYTTRGTSKADRDWIAQNKQTDKPGRIEGMGSTKRQRQAEELESPEHKAGVDKELTEATDEQVKDLSTRAAEPEAKHFLTTRSLFNPMSLGESGKVVADTLRWMLGGRFVKEQRFEKAMAQFSNFFLKRTTPRNFEYDAESPLPPNWETQRAIDSGETDNLTDLEKNFAGDVRKLLDEAVRQIRSIRPELLQALYENYFPRFWVDAEGKDASAKALALIRSHRPWEGGKGFLKTRTLAMWEDALKQGLKPRYDNPVDAAYAKLGEMWHFLGALKADAVLKERGVMRFKYVFGRMPDGWETVVRDDAAFKVHAPPTVTIKEAYDAQIRAKTLEMFKSLGISNERLARIGHGGAWGLAFENPEKVQTKFGGADFVFWHEFGHIMDYRFPDLRKVLGLSDRGTGRTGTDKELRDLADLRFEGNQRFEYRRRAEEKMANVFDAYIRAPELFQKTAPTVYANLLRWLELHPEVKGPISEIRPSLKLGNAETEQFVGGPILLGEWIMPSPAAQVMRNYLSRTTWSNLKTLRGIKTLGGGMSNVRLLSGFHAQMVNNDAMASGLSLAMYDGMRGAVDRKPELFGRAAKSLASSPVSGFIALHRGSEMIKYLRDENANVSETTKQITQYAIDANLRSGHFNAIDNGVRRWREAFHETGNAFNANDVVGTGRAALSTFLRTPLAVADAVMRPVMQWFVPRMKLGLFAPMAMRIVADNPGADVETLRRLMAKAADEVENRVGQVTYDNMFLSKSVKDAGQLTLQAFGWHATKERMLFGAASDYFKAGKALIRGERPEITFRMAYMPSLVLTHAIIGGTMMYLLTGRKPSKLIDYMFPETGLLDANGKPVRVAIADFLKDYLGEWNAAMHGPKAVVNEWEHRLLPVWNELADMYRNKDFYNTKIFSERNFDETEWQHVWNNLKEGAQYLEGSNEPFSTKGAERFKQNLGPNATPLQKMLAEFGPYLGFVPAPQSLTQTAAEARASEIMRDSFPAMSKDQSAHVQAITKLVNDVRTGKINDEGVFEARATSAGVKDKAELTRITERVLWTPLQYQIHKLPIYEPGSGRDAMSVWDLMTKDEKVQNASVYADKIQRAYDGGKLDAATTGRLVQVVLPYYKQAKARKAQPQGGSKVAPPQANRYSAFQ